MLGLLLLRLQRWRRESRRRVCSCGGGVWRRVSGRRDGLTKAERSPDARLFALVKLVEVEAKGKEFEIVVRMRVEHQKKLVHHVLVGLVHDHQLGFERRDLRDEAEGVDERREMGERWKVTVFLSGRKRRLIGVFWK